MRQVQRCTKQIKVTRGWCKRGTRELLFNKYRVSVWGDEKVQNEQWYSHIVNILNIIELGT